MAVAAAAVACFALGLAWMQRLHGLWYGTCVVVLIVAVVGYAVYYVIWFALEIRGPFGELVSVCWNHHILKEAKESCR